MTTVNHNRIPRQHSRFDPGSARKRQPASDDALLALRYLVATASSKQQLYQSLLEWLTQQAGCAAAGFFLHHQTSGLVPGSSNLADAAFANEAFLNATQQSAIACAQGKTDVTDVPNIRNVVLVSAPVSTEDENTDVLTAALIFTPDQQPDTSGLLLAATHATLWHQQSKHQRVQHQLALSAATIDLLATIERADSLRAASIVLVNTLRDHLQCRAIVLGLRKSTRVNCKVAAVSGLPDFDRNGVLTDRLQGVLDDSVVCGGLTIFPPAEDEDRDTSLAHQSLARDVQAERIVSHPLTDNDGQTIGAWIAIDDQRRDRSIETILRAAAPRVADALQLAKRADRSIFAGSKKRQHHLRRLWQAAIVCSVCVAILLIPVPYRIHCQCSAEPDIRRFIVAPFEGLIEKTHVEPGDVVKFGQLLAQMDGREIRWELAGSVAEREKAVKERDAQVLAGDAGAAQRAALDLQRIQSREQILLHRVDQLQLTAPIDGIVLDGHLERVENAPVTIGQPVYEVAPLSPVIVEIAIPDDEFTNVMVGYEVLIRFDGLDKDFHGSVQRVYPRSEVRERDNVFIAEVALNNADHKMRPGMNGYARITSTSRSLAWNLLHKPWEHFRKALPF